MEKFEVVILGNDINVYSVARAFYEEYGVVSNAFGLSVGGINVGSKIVNYKFIPNVDKTEAFLPTVNSFAKEHSDKKVFVLGCGDNYIEVIAENKDKYESNIITHCPSLDDIRKLIRKEDFYELCDKYGVERPKTFIHNKDTGLDFNLDFEAPFILKPSNSVMYWDFPFEGKKKVFKLNSREELNSTLNKVYKSGYTDHMIIQEFIPGNDTAMRVLTNYSDSNGKVKMMALGHVLLEEHTPKGIGNHAVIITEPNTELMDKYKKFLEEISFVGFSNFDIKYDERDNKFKVFEINVRQGRSNFYVTAGGCNIAKCLVEEYIEKKDKETEFVTNKILWMVVPKKVAFKYIPEYKDEMQKLIKENECINPLFYKKDKKLIRNLRLFKAYFAYYKKYKDYGNGR